MPYSLAMDGRASPRLKDAEIPASAFPALYVELLLTTRRLYHECKLVHADLSEYNILYHVEPPAVATAASPAAEGTSQQETPGYLYIIDVSQSVEHDHPHAFDFLRSDLRNVEDFFSKRGVHCLGLRRAFEFVTKDSFEAEGGDAAALQSRLEQEDDEPQDREHGRYEGVEREGQTRADEDAVFMRSYIPRTLNEVYDPERDVGALNRGERENLIYKDTIGIVAQGESRVRFEDNGVQDDDVAGEESDESGEDGSEDESEEGESARTDDRKPRGHRHEDREAKKVSCLPLQMVR